jgi:hypothetical protein
MTDRHGSQGNVGPYELIILSTTRTPSTDLKKISFRIQLLHHKITSKMDIFNCITGEVIRVLLLSKLAKSLEFYIKLHLIGRTNYLMPAK